MAGSKEGAAKATKTRLKRYGKNYYSELGKKGGKVSKGGGFAHMAKNDPEKHKEASRKGGLKQSD